MFQDYEQFLRQRGYEIFTSKYHKYNSLRVTLIKGNEEHVTIIRGYWDLISPYEKESAFERALIDLEKKFYHKSVNPAWTDQQKEAIFDIAERLVQYAHSQPNESVLVKFEGMADELKNIVPMKKES